MPAPTCLPAIAFSWDRRAGPTCRAATTVASWSASPQLAEQRALVRAELSGPAVDETTCKRRGTSVELAGGEASVAVLGDDARSTTTSSDNPTATRIPRSRAMAETAACIAEALAAELAALRPEVVERLAVIAPFGIADESNPGYDEVMLVWGTDSVGIEGASVRVPAAAAASPPTRRSPTAEQRRRRRGRW